jgi:hypothetical protein
MSVDRRCQVNARQIAVAAVLGGYVWLLYSGGPTWPKALAFGMAALGLVLIAEAWERKRLRLSRLRRRQLRRHCSEAPEEGATMNVR